MWTCIPDLCCKMPPVTSDAESCVTRRQSFRINGNFYKREETYRILKETKPPNKNDSLARGQIYNKYTRKYTSIYISEEQTAVKCLFLLAQLCWLVCIYICTMFQGTHTNRNYKKYTVPLFNHKSWGILEIVILEIYEPLEHLFV